MQYSFFLLLLFFLAVSFNLVKGQYNITNATDYGHSEIEINMTVTLNPNEKLYYAFLPLPEATLSYQITWISCPLSDCSLDALVIDHNNFTKLESGTLDLASIPAPLYSRNITIFNVTVAFNPIANDTTYFYLVFLNSLMEPVTFEYNLRYAPFPQESCLAFMLGTTGIILIIIITLLCCGVQQILPNREKPNLMHSFHLDQSDIPKFYPYIEPHPVKCIPRCTIPILQQQTTGWGYYYLHCDDILWIWFPEPIETLRKGQRVIITITFMAVYLLFFTSWGKTINPIATQLITEVLPTSSPSYIRFVVFKVVSALTLVSVIALIYRPILRVLTKSEPLWQQSSSKFKRAVGQLLQFTGGIILLFVCCGVAVSMLSLLNDYTCEDFIEGVIVPFTLTVLFKSTIVGVPLRYVGYRLECTWGIPPPANLIPPKANERAVLMADEI
eukprot:TRINITY_DN8883_c0_g1_i2.p1 TRINITY_DN8883_c0_g1~~TRINITY_DN8883_c0_g1_i2.p1  ORF type:complete len:443 (+),score=54.83 TRINITY_DN8883_c0_g1_i2:100-1428(+)